jgi:hypothetical protein
LGPSFKNQTNVTKNTNEALSQLFLKALLRPKEGQQITPTTKFELKKEHIL